MIGKTLALLSLLLACCLAYRHSRRSGSVRHLCSQCCEATVATVNRKLEWVCQAKFWGGVIGGSGHLGSAIVSSKEYEDCTPLYHEGSTDSKGCNEVCEGYPPEDGSTRITHTVKCGSTEYGGNRRCEHTPAPKGLPSDCEVSGQTVECTKTTSSDYACPIDQDDAQDKWNDTKGLVWCPAKYNCQVEIDTQRVVIKQSLPKRCA
eukprot:gnl/Spiro4/12144_TR6409_c0_g1_i1.p1 gnl/Spiro4/12144_TR6409_c0_g1~~gnl/Spiro4/12144_TR6409_c0_g1_i1.p1  ORF type:complete len:214 (-),score=9.08 gnl/Spiro4/12144_TR6409_c0_g1_i1:69-683(-)